MGQGKGEEGNARAGRNDGVSLEMSMMLINYEWAISGKWHGTG